MKIPGVFTALKSVGGRILSKGGLATPGAVAADAGSSMRSVLARRESMVKALAPTEYLRGLDYKVRTPAVGDVMVTTGHSKVTFAQVGGELLPESVETAVGHRGKGLASYMYRVAEEATGMKISTKATRTEMGAAFVKKRRYQKLDLSQLHHSMQASTNQVKANTTGYTTPGSAMHPLRGGSRQGPQGGTGG